MRAMVEAGEAAALVPERVWQETASALAEPRPDVFIQVLRDCGALAVVFPEVDALFGVPQPADWHPEIDTGVHVRTGTAAGGAPVLQHGGPLCRARPRPGQGHDTARRSGRATWATSSAASNWSRPCASAWRCPTAFATSGVAVARNHGLCHRALELRPVTLLKLLESLDAFRRGERVTEFLDACEADARGRTGLEDQPYPQRDLVLAAWRAALAVDARAVAGPGGAGDGLAGEKLGEAIRNARLAAVDGGPGAVQSAADGRLEPVPEVPHGQGKLRA